MSEKLYEIISRIMNISVSEITDESNQESIESWDSFNVYVMLDEIESVFNTRFNIDEIIEIKKVGDIKKLLEKHGVL